MAIITTPEDEPIKSSKEFEPRQATIIPAGLYGGMFAWYSLPKEYPKFQEAGTETKFYVGFVITHDRAYRQLPAFSAAMRGIKVKSLFYSSKSGMKSGYLELLYALLGGKKGLEEISWFKPEEIPDLDTLIGRPVTLFVEPGARPDKDGVTTNRITGLEPADRDLLKAIKPLYDSKVVERTEKGTMRLTSPAVAYQEVGAKPAPLDTFGTDDELEVPF